MWRTSSISNRIPSHGLCIICQTIQSEKRDLFHATYKANESDVRKQNFESAAFGFGLVDHEHFNRRQVDLDGEDSRNSTRGCL